MGLFLWSEMESLCLEVEGVSLGFEDVNGGGGDWFVFFKQLFSVFKQHYMYFYIFFHSHVFPQIFSNNNFQFLNICTKRAHSLGLSGLSNYVDLMAALIVKSK